MANVTLEIPVNASAQGAWEAIRDYGAPHRRITPGVLVDARLEDDGAARLVTFANGMAVRELIVDCNDSTRRLVWAATGGNLEHHNAAMQVSADGEARCIVRWTADFLPAEAEPMVRGLMTKGAAAMQETLQAAAGR